MWGRRRGIDLVDTPEMDDFFERLEQLDQAEMMSLGAAWRAADGRAREDAWTTVRAIGARDGLSSEIARVRDRAKEFVSRASDLVPLYGLNDSDLWLQAKGRAGEAIVDAALAIALGDRLDAASRDALLGPWLFVTEAVD
jgi:hypothetical protein